jgi:hypothetical protein
MKNQLIDLNNHLFAKIERLGDESLSLDQVALEVDRARAICGVSIQIVSNATLALNAAKFKTENKLHVKARQMLNP